MKLLLTIPTIVILAYFHGAEAKLRGGAAARQLIIEAEETNAHDDDGCVDGEFRPQTCNKDFVALGEALEGRAAAYLDWAKSTTTSESTVDSPGEVDSSSSDDDRKRRLIMDNLCDGYNWGGDGWLDEWCENWVPTQEPTPGPSPGPTAAPTQGPTPGPTPSPEPTPGPTPAPTQGPTPGPTPAPSPEPTPGPTPAPTQGPTPGPTPGPSPEPTPGPTPGPTPLSRCVDAMCESRPSEMIFQYLGGSCEETETRSTDTQYDCREESNLFPQGADVHIIAHEDSNRDDAEVYFDGSVTVGEDIVLSSDKIAAFTIIEIYYPDVPDPENLVQTIEILTSCSKPLYLNDRFGSVQLVAFHNERQGMVNCD